MSSDHNLAVTAVPGVEAGHWTHHTGTTGVTVALFPEGARGAVHVPGSAPGGREIGALDPGHLAGEIHGLCLSGGSAFGLAAADGVMKHLASRGIGFAVGEHRIPIVPAAILFDLDVGAMKPGSAEGLLAAASATTGPLREGRVGAAAGATVAKVTGAPEPGGFGGWSEKVDGWTVAAGVAVNALGSVYDPSRGEWVAGGPLNGEPIVGDWRGQTTLAIVTTDAPLDRAAAGIVAKMAAAGLARTLYPAFTPFDGDTVFVASTGVGAPIEPRDIAAIGAAAAKCVATAILRGCAGPG